MLSIQVISGIFLLFLAGTKSASPDSSDVEEVSGWSPPQNRSRQNQNVGPSAQMIGGSFGSGQPHPHGSGGLAQTAHNQMVAAGATNQTPFDLHMANSWQQFPFEIGHNWTHDSSGPGPTQGEHSGFVPHPNERASEFVPHSGGPASGILPITHGGSSGFVPITHGGSQRPMGQIGHQFPRGVEKPATVPRPAERGAMIGQKRQVINLEEDVGEPQQPEYLSKGKGQQRFVETAEHHHHYFGRSAVPIGPEHAQRPPGDSTALTRGKLPIVPNTADGQIQPKRTKMTLIDDPLFVNADPANFQRLVQQLTSKDSEQEYERLQAASRNRNPHSHTMPAAAVDVPNLGNVNWKNIGGTSSFAIAKNYNFDHRGKAPAAVLMEEQQQQQQQVHHYPMSVGVHGKAHVREEESFMESKFKMIQQKLADRHLLGVQIVGLRRQEKAVEKHLDDPSSLTEEERKDANCGPGFGQCVSCDQLLCGVYAEACRWSVSGCLFAG